MDLPVIFNNPGKSYTGLSKKDSIGLHYLDSTPITKNLIYYSRDKYQHTFLGPAPITIKSYVIFITFIL